MRIRVVDDPDALADLAAASIARLLREGPGGRVSLGLAGGGTPRTTYVRLREEDVPWESVDAWLSDERWVPPDDPDSNGRMVRTALTDHVPVAFHPVPWEAGSPQHAALDYETTLRTVLSAEDGLLRPDVVILGVGDDGHTASLFPDTAALHETGRLYVANWVPQHRVWRVTATFPLLQAARHVLFLATGSGKAAIVASLLEGEADLPAGRLSDERVTWFLDDEAAADLTSTAVERV